MITIVKQILLHHYGKNRKVIGFALFGFGLGNVTGFLITTYLLQ